MKGYDLEMRGDKNGKKVCAFFLPSFSFIEPVIFNF